MPFILGLMERKSASDTVKKLRIVLIGMSHARHLAEALKGMGATVFLLKITICRPTTAGTDKAAAELSVAICGEEMPFLCFSSWTMQPTMR